MKKIISNEAANYNVAYIVLLFLVFSPIPLGLGRSQLNVVQFLAAIYGIVIFGWKKDRSVELFAAGMCVVGIMGTGIYLYENMGKEGIFVFEQVARTLAFLGMAFLVAHWGIGAKLFFAYMDNNIKNIMYLLMMQVILSYLYPSLINSPLGSGDYAGQWESVARIYIYPHAIMYALVPFFIYKMKYRLALFGTVVLAMTGSRQVYMFIVFSWIICSYEAKNAKKAFFGLFAVLCVIFMAVVSGAAGRFLEFADGDGDQIRLEEIARAMDAWGTNVWTKLFGIGFGTRYWEGWDYVLNAHDADVWLINSGFDVHNGFSGILMRTGIVGSVLAIFGVYVMHNKLPAQLFLTLILGALLSLSSASSFYTSDILLYTIGILYIKSNLTNEKMGVES